MTAEIRATTVFGNKYISFSSPKSPVAQHVSSNEIIDAASVTTEFNTVFETVTAIAEQVDPVKLNQTLAAAAEALSGLGDEFGESLLKGNRILGDLNGRMPQIRVDTQRVAGLADVYADASPDLWAGLENAVQAARTFNDYRGMIFCTIRNYHDVAPDFARVLGNNGYSLASAGTILGAGNPFVYPDNLPRVNAHGGPEGRPGCWQKITRELWPNPYLVMDTGYSLAAYNHVEIGQPFLIDYVCGRQIGEPTINP
ncbi:phospholipid/cholesterol/gamma-HCH transport system substrate-binding protein [Mycobacterium sp. URHB0021]